MNVRRLVVGCIAAGVILCLAASIFLVGQAPSLPAPTVDRVGFPSGYQNTFKVFYTFDNYQNRQIRKVWGNDVAASVTPGQAFNFPYGSVILFESYTIRQDASGEPVLDENGRFIPVNLTTLFVMRKERGFGEEYRELRNGEWEYIAYRPDGTVSTPPSATGACAQCHLFGGALPATPEAKRIGASWDYVFRPDLYFSNGNGAVPKGVMQHYVFVPSTIHAKPGENVTVYNDDQLVHRIVADDGTFDTGIMTAGASFTVKAPEAGTAINYHCTIHSRMKGQIVADPPPIVVGLVFNPATVRVGQSFSAVFSGTNLNNQTYFDVRYRAPGGIADQEISNWQRGATANPLVASGTAAGTWTITAVRPHQDETDHSGTFTSLSATITVAMQ
jgi:plastocyanin